MLRAVKSFRNQEIETSTIHPQTLDDSSREGDSVLSNHSGVTKSVGREFRDRAVPQDTVTRQQESRKIVKWHPDDELCGTWGTTSSRTRYSHGDDKHINSHVEQMRQQSTGIVLGLGKAFARIATAGLKSPMDFSISISRGFQNTQKLYGDKMVRHPNKVTDLRSGLAAAGRVFGFGILDAISGVIVQPLHGAREGGSIGLLKGIGRGLAGVVLKPGAAISGLPAYTFKGMYKELKNYISLDFSRYIIGVRKVQGEEEWHRSTSEARQGIIQRWQELTSTSQEQA